MLRATILGLMFAATPAMAQEWPPGETIDPSLHVDITDDGFQSLTGALGGLLPPSIPVPDCLLYTSPSPRDATLSRMPSSA